MTCGLTISIPVPLVEPICKKWHVDYNKYTCTGMHLLNLSVRNDMWINNKYTCTTCWTYCKKWHVDSTISITIIVYQLLFTESTCEHFLQKSTSGLTVYLPLVEILPCKENFLQIGSTSGTGILIVNPHVISYNRFNKWYMYTYC